MKKLFSLILAGILALAVTGCGNGGGNSGTDNDTAKTETASQAGMKTITLTATDADETTEKSVVISYPEEGTELTEYEDDPSSIMLTNESKDYELTFELLMGKGYNDYKEALSDHDGFIEQTFGSYSGFSYNSAGAYETDILLEEADAYDAYLVVYTTPAEYTDEESCKAAFELEEVQKILSSIEYK